MPRVDYLIDCVGKSTYISTLHLTRGYWQVPVPEIDWPKTAFATPFGLYQFNTMPFGLHEAPATFQRLMDCVIRKLGFAATYLDDRIVFSESWEDNLIHIWSVLEQLRRAGLTAKAKKCEFGTQLTLTDTDFHNTYYITPLLDNLLQAWLSTLNHPHSLHPFYLGVCLCLNKTTTIKPTSHKKVTNWKQGHVGMEPSKTSQTG